MAEPHDWHDLSDDELLARLEQRRVNHDVAVYLVWHREEVNPARHIAKALSAGAR